MTIRFGEDDDWPALAAASTDKGGQRPQLSVAQVTELGRFPPTPWPYTVADGQLIENPEVQAARDEQIRRAYAQLYTMLQQSPRKDVLVFVHGFNNRFNDAALTLGQLWHALGRIDVPILYSWPADRGGLGGYAYDRECGEFTAFHLKPVICSKTRSYDATHSYHRRAATPAACCAADGDGGANQQGRRTRLQT